MLVNSVASVTPYAFAYITRFIVDDVLELGVDGNDMAGFTGAKLAEKTTLLGMAVGMSVGLQLVGITCSWLFNYSAVFVSQRMVFSLREELYKKLQALQLTFFDQRLTGKLMARVLDDVSVIQDNVTSTFVSIVSNIMMLIAGILVCTSVNPLLTAITLVTVPCYVFVYQFFRKPIKANAKELREHSSRIYGLVEEKVTGVRVLKAFASEIFEVRQYTRMAAKALRLSMTQAKLGTLLGVLAGFVSTLGTGLIMYIGATDVRDGAMSMGDLLLFMGSVGYLFAPSVALVGLGSTIQWVLVVLRRVFEILDEPIEISDLPGAVELDEVKGEIEFKGVSLKYPSAPKNALTDINVTIPPGSVVAIMGPSGSGKSSFVQLLMRFYEATEGDVLIDGHPVRDVVLTSLRKQISMVAQEVTVFTGTIAENIVYGRFDAKPAEVVQAAKWAQLHQFVMKLPEKYETRIGEHGASLSGGQRQRLAIAMSLVTNPQILVLDDSTSALDAETESKIRATLKQIMKDRTAFVITHRVATARDADIILVLEGGKITEMGNHEELSKGGGLYSRFVTVQESGFLDLDDG
ncbi:MAG: ABC transporter ATP-binding protein [Candidatus Latescibacteria bacterium]|nr:ABC transporter ATP-binding protein [Candidatus Latescibacterota bacterium]